MLKLSRRRALLTGAAGLLVPAAPAIVRAQLWQPAPGVGTKSASGGAAWTLLTHTKVQSGSATTITTPDPGIDTTGAGLIVTGWMCLDSLVTVTDNKGNSPYIQQFNRANPNQQVAGQFFRSPVVGSGHKFTFSTGINMFGTFMVAAFAETPVSSPIDGSAVSATGTSGTLATGSYTPTQVNDLLITVMGGYSLGGNGSVASIDNGFTIIESGAQDSNDWAGAMAWLSYNSTTAINPTWTWTTGGGGDQTTTCLVGLKHA